MRRKDLTNARMFVALLSLCSIFFGSPGAAGINPAAAQAPAGIQIVAEAVEPAVTVSECADPAKTDFINREAAASLEKLPDPYALVTVGGKTFVKIGTYPDSETAMEVYRRARQLYYGNLKYMPAISTHNSGEASLYYYFPVGTAQQAYDEHCAAKGKLLEIAKGFTGTDSEKAEQIFQYVTGHVSYADPGTLERLHSDVEMERYDYRGIQASIYTAVMENKSTCDGQSGMMLALLEMSGVKGAKVWNDLHAYNVVYADGNETTYDPTWHRRGKIEEIVREKDIDKYEPKYMTCGYSITVPQRFVPQETRDGEA